MNKKLSTNMDKAKAVILANGDYPTHPAPLLLLQEADYVVCCDGGADAYIRQGNTPDLIIGDGDSLTQENKQRFASIIHHVSDQESNDQTKAVHFLLTHGFQHITILGATGKREDHTLGNISLLIDYMRLGATIRTVTDYGIFVPCHDTYSFACKAGQQVSIINFSACDLKAEGLVYPLSDFTNWWQGTLNECTGNQCTIHAQGNYLLFINHPDILKAKPIK